MSLLNITAQLQAIQSSNKSVHQVKLDAWFQEYNTQSTLKSMQAETRAWDRVKRRASIEELSKYADYVTKKAVDDGDVDLLVFMVDGMKDVTDLRDCGICAVCNTALLSMALRTDRPALAEKLEQLVTA